MMKDVHVGRRAIELEDALKPVHEGGYAQYQLFREVLKVMRNRGLVG